MYPSADFRIRSTGRGVLNFVNLRLRMDACMHPDAERNCQLRPPAGTCTGSVVAVVPNRHCGGTWRAVPGSSASSRTCGSLCKRWDGCPTLARRGGRAAAPDHESQQQSCSMCRGPLGPLSVLSRFFLIGLCPSDRLYMISKITAPRTGRHRDASNGVRMAYRGLKVEENLRDQLLTTGNSTGAAWVRYGRAA